MTATTLYSASIPLVRRGLVNLGACLAKAADHFAERNVAEADWLGAALAPDMFPLLRQVQVTSDVAKFLAARLAGTEPPVMPDVEASLAELQDRLANTIAYLDSMLPSAIDGREEADIVLTLPKASLHFTGASYLRDFALANFFFHVTTAYGIMRNQGVPLTKFDYIGPIDMVPRD